MSLPNPKDLKKLAKACREAGILYFKSGDFEFSLDPNSQPKVVNKAKKQTPSDVQGAVESNMPSPEELLWWSVQAVPGENTKAEQ